MLGRSRQGAKAISRPLYGVNLGGWLMLERWLTPTLFTGLSRDEYTLLSAADKDGIARIRRHYGSFITRQDFIWLKSCGIKAVRLPVNHGVFGDVAPYISTVSYIDKAFRWAEETGIQILLDLHTAPGSQNGNQESGRIGPITWHKHEENIVAALSVVSRLAKRYGKRKNLLGIELLNEPSPKIPKRKLLKYYQAAYKLIRDETGAKVWVVFSDNFKPRRWRKELHGSGYENVYIDTHQYQVYTKKDKRLDASGHVARTLGRVQKEIIRMARTHPVLVGEWSVALDPRSLKGLTPVQQDGARWLYGGAQLMAFEQAAGWFYWTYKTEDGGPWSFRECVEKGWLPDFRT